MPAAHARVGASSLHRTLPCPGSVGLIESLGDEERTSEFAAHGTVAHHVRECCLAYGFEPEEFLGDELGADGFDFAVDDEMVEALRPGIEWVRERPGRVVNEMRVNASDEMPGQFGTLDVGVIAPDLITINDHKFGERVAVQPEENEQLQAYGLWFWENVARHETDATDFLLVIDQPRNDSGGGEWWTTLDHLLEFKERLREGFDLIFTPEERARSANPDDWRVNPDAPLCAGEKQCQFCAAAGVCGELARFNLDLMGKKFDDLDDEELTFAQSADFTPARRALAAKNAPLFKKWIEAVQQRVLRDAIQGLPTPGVKAVKGRKLAKAWCDDGDAELFLLMNTAKPILTPRKLISPTQAEELIPKALHPEMKELWRQADGKPVLASEDVDKPAICMADKFED